MYIIYGSTNCPLCDIAKEMLDEEGLEYTYHNAYEKYGEDWRQIFTELRQKNMIPPTWRTIPMIFNKGKFIGGCQELQKHLESRIEQLDDF
jgi:glutaredoxin